jgi:hypothetical protein
MNDRTMDGDSMDDDNEGIRQLEELNLRLHPLEERPFSDAWLRGVQFHPRYSVFFQETGHLSSDNYRHWPPNVARIKKELDELPSSNAIFLAAMVSFYNGPVAGFCVARGPRG